MFNIGIDVQWSAYPFTGIGKHTTRWVEQLAEMDQKNRYFLFCASKEVLPESLLQVCLQRANFSWVEVDPGFMNRLPSRLSLFLRDQVLIPRAAFANRCRVVIFPYFNVSLCLLPRSMVCITDFAIYLDRKNHSFFQRAYYNSLLKAAAWRAKGLFAISKATQADTSRYLGIPADRVPVIYPGVEAHFRPVPKAEARAWCRARHEIDFPFVLYTGGYAVRKNLPRLLRVFSRVQDLRGNNLKLVMTGKLDENSALYRKLQSDHPGMAVLLSRVPEEELSYLYRAAELVVYPSLYEGFGLPILEAQACGAPVVTSNLSSMPEVAGGAAILVDPTDEDALAEAMLKGLTDRTLRKRLIRDGLINAQRYTWRGGARQLKELLELQKPGSNGKAGRK